MDFIRNYRFSIIAGVFAASGSFFCKLIGFLPAFEILQDLSVYATNFLRLIPILLMITCNATNVKYFLKSLEQTGQTLIPTVVAVGTNYFVTFILAAIVFNETITLMSIIGCCVIVCGLWFLCSNEQDRSNVQQKTHNE